MTRLQQTVASSLERIDVPGAAEADARSLSVARRAFREREPVAHRSRRPWALGFAALGLAALTGLLSPPGRALVDRVREVVGVEQAQPALFSLPVEGRLLVASDTGVWVVERNGKKRLLGRYRNASWSPYGRFVVATRANELAALEPDGTIRWTLARPDVRFAQWAGTATDTRIAYIDRTGLRVVAGDGNGDRLIAAGERGLVAWQPGDRFVLASASGGRVRVRDAAGRMMWTAALPTTAPVTAIEWSDDGRRLLVLSPHHLRVFDTAGRVVAGDDPSEGWPDVAATFVRGSQDVAVARVHGSQSSVYLLEGPMLFNGPGVVTDVRSSPDGRWLLVAWRTADQWLFVGLDRPKRLRAVAGIEVQFRSAGFPRVASWCCAPRT